MNTTNIAAINVAITRLVFDTHVPVPDLVADIERIIANLRRVNTLESRTIATMAFEALTTATEPMHRAFVGERECQRELVELRIWVGMVKLGWV
jgi:hypothetical protein